MPLSVLLACFLAACDVSEVPPQEPRQPDPNGAQQAAPASALHAKIIGEWNAQPPAAEARLLPLAKAALADPPDKAALDRMRADDDERQHFANIVRLRTEEPGSSLLAALRKRIAEIESIRLTFSKDQLVSTTPTSTHVERYRAEAEVDDQLVVLVEGEGPVDERRALFRFVDDDHIVMRKGLHEIPFYRTGAASILPTGQPSSSMNELTDRGGAAGSGADSAMPPKTGDVAFDACVADYFACVSQMPPESQDAMKSSLDLVRLRMRQAAKDPEERRSFTETCTSTVKLIKSTGLCH